jgi:hypothetical protein
MTHSVKTVAIVQSSYIPWKGYFDLINGVDEFILLDDVQFTRRDWRSRNVIKTPQGLTWLSIPVEVKGRYHQRICDTRVADASWARRHWSTIRHNYAKAPCFARYEGVFSSLYLGELPALLSEINYRFINAVCSVLGIHTPIRWSMDFSVSNDRTDRLIDLCKAVGATRYLSGPTARAYLDENRFRAAGIGVCWMNYAGYPEYPQLHGPFVHGVSILDLLFNVGAEARSCLLSFAKTLHG